MTSGDLAGATIVFDLDGTLVDTAPDLSRALNDTLDLEGLPHVPLTTVRRMVGQGARILIERAAAHSGVSFSAERMEQLTKAYLEFYRADISSGSTPFEGVEDALDDLAAGGARLSVCTNKRTDLSVQLLETLGLAARFAAIVGADAVVERKPHPDHFRSAVTRAGGEVRHALMVGDTSADVIAAREAGAPVIAVRFGYCDGDVDRLGADAVLNSFAELPTCCRRLLAPPAAGVA